MKVVVTGATGFVGQEVLKQCIENPAITSVIVLSRRHPTAVEAVDPKVKVVLVDNFLHYSAEVLSGIQGANACIWALGMSPSHAHDLEETKRVSVNYTVVGASAFTQQAAENNLTLGKFRFVYLSGGAAERDQQKALWMLGPYRKIRGQTENEVLQYAKEHRSLFEAYVLRPGMILKKEFNLRDLARGLFLPSVRVDALAKVMIDVALKGFECDTLDNTRLKQVLLL